MLMGAVMMWVMACVGAALMTNQGSFVIVSAESNPFIMPVFAIITEVTNFCRLH